MFLFFGVVRIGSGRVKIFLERVIIGKHHISIVAFDQHFDIVVPNDAGSPRSIITVTHRKDCRRGIKVEVENGPVVNTYTLGEVP